MVRLPHKSECTCGRLVLKTETRAELTAGSVMGPGLLQFFPPSPWMARPILCALELRPAQWHRGGTGKGAPDFTVLLILTNLNVNSHMHLVLEGLRTSSWGAFNGQEWFHRQKSVCAGRANCPMNHAFRVSVITAQQSLQKARKGWPWWWGFQTSWHTAVLFFLLPLCVCGGEGFWIPWHHLSSAASSPTAANHTVPEQA